MKMEKAQLAVGHKAPAIRAVAVGGEFGDGREVALEDLRGKPVVLYFYPKDDTPGCTAQACGLRDSWGSVRGKAQIFGVSVDSPKSHRKFIDKYELPFPLLSDPEKKIVNAYGVWVEKSMYGRKYMGAERSTFVIDAEGRIAAIFRKVKPEEHIDLVRDALKKLADK
jgi:thioredoxin-dependent peroxiredoxin